MNLKDNFLNPNNPSSLCITYQLLAFDYTISISGGNEGTKTSCVNINGMFSMYNS
jgi:hypothetical protein